MRQKQTITINIPEPCHKSWEEMQPSGCGRFCAHCEKMVIDFTKMSDEEIVKIFTAQKDQPPCGQFTDAQLNRALVSNEQRKPFQIPAMMTKLATAFLLVPAFFQNSFAQEQQKPKTEQSQIPVNNKPIILKGKITDSASGQPLVAMEISIDKLDYVEYSDRHGNFSFLLPGNLRNQEITIKASYQNTSSPEIKETMIQPLTVLVSTDLCNKVLPLTRTKDLNIPEQGSLPIISSYTTSGAPIMNYSSVNHMTPDNKFTNEQQAHKVTFWQRIGRFFKGKK